MKNKLVISLGLLLGIACSSLQAQDDARTASYLKQIEAQEKTDSKRIFGLEEFGDSAMSAIEKEALTKDWIMTDTHVLITAITKGDINTLNDELKALGIKDAKIHGKSITGMLPIKNIPQLENCSVSTVRPEIAKTNVGLVDNEAVEASFGKNITELFGLDGSGIKVGIISSGFFPASNPRWPILSGDLPGEGNPNGYTKEVQLLSIERANNEGGGMGELIHDIAPGAELFFHSGLGGLFDFANGIMALANAGCDIIVDDIGYVSLPFFQDGIVSDAINKVRDMGVTYFTAAGNESNSSYQAPYKPSGIFAEDGGEYHDFGGGDITQRVSFLNTKTGEIALQWDDSFFQFVNEESAGDPKTNIDIFIFNAETGTLVNSGTTPNYSFPLEILKGGVFGTMKGRTNYDIMIKKVSGPDPTYIKYIDSAKSIRFEEEFEGNNAGTIFGKANAEGAITVGAMSFLQSPAFGGSFNLENFSSYGGTPIVRDERGNLMTPVFRQKPDVIGTDGTNNASFDEGIDIERDGFPNFFGTSAAAPNLAGIAALMLQANKDLTPQDIKRIMIAAAVDMDNPATDGFDTGYDVASGNGYVLADKAIIMAAPKSVLPEKPTVYRYQAVNSDTNRVVGAIVDGNDLSLNLIEGGVINIEALVVGGTETSVAMELEGNTAFTVPNQKLRQFVQEYSQRSRREVRNRRGNGKDISTLSTAPEVSAIDGFTDFNGTLKRTAVENVAPYSLFGDRNGNFNQWSPGVGSYTLKATPYSEKNASGIQGETDIINFNISYTPSTFLLVSNANDPTGMNSFIFLDDQGEIDLGLLTDRPNITAFLAAPGQFPGLVEFPLVAQIDYELSGTQQFSTSDTTALFSVFGDDEGGATGFWNAPEVGPYALRYQILAREGDYSASSTPVFINFNVVDPNATAAKVAIVGNGNVGFTVYPNPTTGILSLEAKNGELSDVQVFNSLGQRVFNHKNTVENLQQVDLSSYDNGLYIIKAFIGSQSFATKIVIQK